MKVADVKVLRVRDLRRIHAYLILRTGAKNGRTPFGINVLMCEDGPKEQCGSWQNLVET